MSNDIETPLGSFGTIGSRRTHGLWFYHPDPRHPLHFHTLRVPLDHPRFERAGYFVADFRVLAPKRETSPRSHRSDSPFVLESRT